MKVIELYYLISSVFLFIWALLMLDYKPYGHGIDIYAYLFICFTMVYIGSGFILTIEARKKKVIFWMLLVATLMAISYAVIPLLSRYACRPPDKELELPLPPPLNSIERIMEYCF